MTKIYRPDLTVSNIAWRTEEEVEARETLKENRVGGVDIAPTKYWPDLTVVSDSQIKRAVKFWGERGIKIVAMQSLLYGRQDLQIFGEAKKRREMLEYLYRVIYLGAKIGVRALVFGSPKNRAVGNDMSYKEAWETSIGFFAKLGKYSFDCGIAFCIEPNHPKSGCNFIVNHKQAVDLVREVNTAGLYLNLDTSTLFQSKEDIQKVIKAALPYAGHVHISEPSLKQVGLSGKTIHKRVAGALKDGGWSGWIGVEMIGADKGSNILQLERSLQFVKGVYS